jgi:hypothetical protein
MQETIAKIDGTFLGFEDHGIFTAIIYFDYGDGGHQGGGTYSLSSRGKGAHGGIDHLMGILNACGVDSWEKLKGRTVFAIREDGWGGTIRGIKPLPTEPGKEYMFEPFPTCEFQEETTNGKK